MARSSPNDPGRARPTLAQTGAASRKDRLQSQRLPPLCPDGVQEAQSGIKRKQKEQEGADGGLASSIA